MDEPTLRDFQRIAVVNRGEPAMRLVRAVREWNRERGTAVKTIALFTDPDREALFVHEADLAFGLGPALVADDEARDETGRTRLKSRYLDLDRLAEALVRTRADAAWVGWGFVAEHAEFAELCQRLGVTFIGPPPEAMRRLGDKIASKKLAETCGVPVVAWSAGPVASPEEVRAPAERIGFPLLVKAAAGGGGRGIRLVSSADALAGALASASAEAQKAFGDGTVFLEGYVAAARHVEVQVIADRHGTVWTAGVRDCSVQRNHQKIVEESPSPAVGPEHEAALCDAAARLARAAGYVNAGTVEFLFRPETGDFRFMEMNTRLQVEHPVTEACTGLDLVRLQLAVARGEPLIGSPPASRGHAIEVRLCAEDPERGFAPAPGRVVCFRPPLGPGVRTDAGLREGDAIPVEFDSMIAKIIAHGATRDEARARLLRALQETLVVVEGGTTNRAFLLRLLEHPDFACSRVDTGWLDRVRRDEADDAGACVALLATAVDQHERQRREEELNFFASAARGRPALASQEPRPVELRHRGTPYEFQVSTLEPDLFRVRVDDAVLEFRFEHDGPWEGRLCFETPDGKRRFRIVSVPGGLEHRVEVDGHAHRVSRDPGGLLRAPAPGLVISLDAAEGANVTAGDRLLGLEAMKMEMPVLAPSAGRVRKVLVGRGVQVAAGDPLLVLESTAAEADAAQGARLPFRGELPPPVDAGEQGFRYIEKILRRVLLGFDVGDDQLDAAAGRWTAASGALLDADLRGPEGGFDAVCRLFSLYLDVETLFSRDYTGGPGARGLSHEQCLHVFLREVRAEGRGLPEAFLGAVRDALAHYGVASLAPSPRLDDALYWLFRSHRIVARKNRVVVALLQRCLDRPAWRESARSPAFRALLERLESLTAGPHPEVCEALHQARYELFDGALLEERRAEAMRRVDAAVARFRGDPDGPGRAAVRAELVATPFGLADHLGPMIPGADPATRALLLETLSRRLYRPRPFGDACVLQLNARSHVLLHEESGPTTILGAFAPDGGLDAVLADLRELASQLPPESRPCVELFVERPAPDDDEDAATLGAALCGSGLAPRVSRVCAVLVPAAGRLRYRTFASDSALFSEETTLRGLHPAIAERLELWRLRNFHVRRVATSENLYLFHAKARQNERDERLFALAEVRDLHPVREASGRLLAVPELENAILQAFHAIREQQARRDARRRLHWNRVTVFVRPALLARRHEMFAIARRLLHAAVGVGLEKTSLRVRLHEDASQVPRDTVVSFSDRSGQRLEMTLAAPHVEPLRALDDYTLQLVRARQRRIAYVYEIVKMLAPPEPTADFPAGDFEEYDLGAGADAGRLVSVKGRPYGQNTANVVTGIVRNFTAKHPEGMARVLVLGDGTRDMGALAEPECRRIIAAIDLAQRLGVPMEWFPVSSGAKIAMDSGTENLDWTAAVLRRIVEFTQGGGEINVVVDGINVGAQSYWNAEATMLMHSRGCLVMTPRGCMLLTGKRALDYSGGVSAEDNRGIGGFERVMGPNGQAQYAARDLDEACRILLRRYEHTYIAPGERHPRRHPTVDPATRDVRESPCDADGFARLGDLWDESLNPGRKKPFDVRVLLRAVADADCAPLERWATLRHGESAVVWDAHLGGWPVCMIGIESRPLHRLGYVPSDGPDAWSGGTLFPLSSKKVARAINAASGNRPVVVLANLSGFDGSPESLRRLQLEYGAEIGRAVVNFRGPLVFCVVARYHGGAYVVFSRSLNPQLRALALTGSYASVIGGAPAAAVVFPEEARALALKDPRVAAMQARLEAGRPGPRLQQEYRDLFARVHAEKAQEIAQRFDSIHSVQRARDVGSLDAIVEPSSLRFSLIQVVDSAYAEHPDAAAAASSLASTG